MSSSINLASLVILAFGFIVGAVLGSFSKVLADRSVKGLTFKGRSKCESCKKELKWFDLLPVISFLLFRGRCRQCHKKISLNYLLIEVVMGVLISALFFVTVPNNFVDLPSHQLIFLGFDLVIKIIAVCVLIIVVLTDMKTGMIYDRITFPSIILVFGLLVISSLYKFIVLYQSLLNHPLGKYLLPPKSDYFFRHALTAADPLTMGLFAAFLMFLFFGSIIFITQGRGMGGGDLKLSILLGLVFGFPNILVLLMIAFLTGSIFGIGLLLAHKKKFGQSIPFGPFLSLAGIITLFYGNQLLNWYLGIRL